MFMFSTFGVLLQVSFVRSAAKAIEVEGLFGVTLNMIALRTRKISCVSYATIRPNENPVSRNIYKANVIFIWDEFTHIFI